jgi:DNA modification methylase
MSTAMNQASGELWQMINGDCCEVLKQLPDDSIHFNIHSPPFSSLYIYSDSERDMGNAADDAEFFEHYAFAIREMFRVMMPGRIVAVHCKDLPRYANIYGTTGLIDFPGACIQEFELAGFVFHSRVTIWKCPVTERERTNNNGLLHKTVKRDSSQLRMGMADYLICFRKPPADGAGLMSDVPVNRPHGFERYVGQVDCSGNANHPSPYARLGKSADSSVEIWRRYAEPVWWDVDQTDVLNFKIARTDKDEKHICPLQLDLIERAVEIWSNADEVVLSPFAGIGSEGVSSLACGRRFIGIELKTSYFNLACGNLTAAEQNAKTPTLFEDEQ